MRVKVEDAMDACVAQKRQNENPAVTHDKEIHATRATAPNTKHCPSNTKIQHLLVVKSAETLVQKILARTSARKESCSSDNWATTHSDPH